MKVTRVLYLLLLGVTFGPAVFAQSASREKQEPQIDPFIRKYNERRALNPEGLLFKVRLKENRKQFHHGEIIALELSFASSKPETFTVNAATYDRSGRLSLDGFALDPHEGAVDPLSDYFKSGLHGILGGGLRSIPVLIVSNRSPYLNRSCSSFPRARNSSSKPRTPNAKSSPSSRSSRSSRVIWKLMG